MINKHVYISGDGYVVGWFIHVFMRFLPLLRLQSFPRGLGKGSDAALVGGWLESVLTQVDPQTVPAACR